MTTPPHPGSQEPIEPTQPLPGWQQPPPPGWQPPPPPGWQPPQGQMWGPQPGAPYGVHPQTGVPYSDKSKIIAGILQLLLPFGIGRFYMGDTRTGVWQLVVTVLTCGIGSLWPFIDGIIILVTDSTDPLGRPLRS